MWELLAQFLMQEALQDEEKKVIGEGKRHERSRPIRTLQGGHDEFVEAGTGKATQYEEKDG